MKLILLLFLILPSVFYSQILINDDTFPLLITENMHSNGTLKIQKIFDYEDYLKTGKYTVKKYSEYYDNGQLHIQTKFKDSKLHGIIGAYWKNGNLKRKDLYKEGNLIEGKIWDQNGNEIEYFKFEIPSQMKD